MTIAGSDSSAGTHAAHLPIVGLRTDIIQAENALEPDEYAEIDRFCSNREAPSLADISRFLAARFSVEMILDPDIILGFASDSSNLPGRAECLCRPSTERECAIVFRACFAAGIPYTISAGKSNLTGSATPDGGALISTVNLRLPSVVVDEERMTADSSAGIILEDFRNEVQALTRGGLIYPVDPTSRGDASVGGTIACNASGFTPGEAGATRPWIESVDFLLPDGMRIRAARGRYISSNGIFRLDRGGRISEWSVPSYHRPNIKNAGGPWSAPGGEMDFVDLVVGSEGIFGMVTACRLKLVKKPPGYLDLVFSLPGETQAVSFLKYLRDRLNGNFEGLTAFEYFGINSRKYMNHEETLFSGNDQVALNVQAPLWDRSVEDAAEEWLEILMEADCGISEDAVMILENERAKAMFLDARHSIPANAIEKAPLTIMTDTVVPFDRFREFLKFTNELIVSAGLDYVSFGHIGDCHVHFMLLPEKNRIEHGLEIYERIVAKSSELGGVYSGEHGTGKRKRLDFEKCYGSSAVEEIRRCKATVDPLFLLNRGNVVEKNPDP